MRFLTIALMTVMGLVSCQSKQENKELPSAEVEQIIKAYMDVKDALVLTDYDKSKPAVQALHNVIMSTEDESLKELMKSVDAMVAAEDVSGQRIHFSALSEDLAELVGGGSKHGTVYKQYCPMAFDDTGAFWFSLEEEVVNPYFGDKMLHCGRVDESY